MWRHNLILKARITLVLVFHHCRLQFTLLLCFRMLLLSCFRITLFSFSSWSVMMRNFDLMKKSGRKNGRIVYFSDQLYAKKVN